MVGHMVHLVFACFVLVSSAKSGCGACVSMLQGGAARADADVQLMELERGLSRIAGQLQAHLETNAAVMAAASTAYDEEESTSSSDSKRVWCCQSRTGLVDGRTCRYGLPKVFKRTKVSSCLKGDAAYDTLCDAVKWPSELE